VIDQRRAAFADAGECSRRTRQWSRVQRRLPLHRALLHRDPRRDRPRRLGVDHGDPGRVPLARVASGSAAGRGRRHI